MAQADTIGKRLIEARMLVSAKRKESLSQQQMADLVGKELGRKVHQPTWSGYEGGNEPPLDTILAVANLSGLAPEYIAWGINSPVGDTTHDPGKAERQRLQWEADAEAEEREKARKKDRPKNGPPRRVSRG